MILYYKKDGYPEIVGGSLNLSIENARTRVMAYGAKTRKETTFLETGAHKILKKDWDTALEGTWDATKVQDDNRYFPVWTRYRLNATDTGVSDDPTWSELDKDDNDEAEKGYRPLDKRIMEDNVDDGGKKEGMIWVKDGGNWKTGAADDVSTGFRFDNRDRPYVKFSGVFNKISGKVKDAVKALTCTFQSNLRLFIQATDHSLADLQTLFYIPFTTRIRERYVKEEAINSRRISPTDTATTETIRDDTQNLSKWTGNQLERVAQQSISGSLTLAGIQTNIKAGQIIDSIDVEGEADIPINAAIVSVNYNHESLTTDIQVGTI